MSTTYNANGTPVGRIATNVELLQNPDKKPDPSAPDYDPEGSAPYEDSVECPAEAIPLADAEAVPAGKGHGKRKCKRTTRTFYRHRGGTQKNRRQKTKKSKTKKSKKN